VEWLIDKILKVLFGSVYLPALLLNELMFRFGKNRIAVGFANDHFEGNPKQIFLFLNNSIRCYWVTNDRHTLRELRNKGFEAYYYWNPGTRLLRPSAWVVSHPNRIPLKRKTCLWIHTHHSIPFKAVLNSSLLEDMSQYDIHFLTADMVRDHFRDKVKVDEETLKVVGQPLVDPLIRDNFVRADILRVVGLDSGKKTVLYAPTWSHDFEDPHKKSLFPKKWAQSQEGLLEEICRFIEGMGLNFIIRLHRLADMWWSDEFDKLIKKSTNVIKMSSASHPDSAPYLSVADVLVTDYSSIANDYIVLNRPIIYLEPDYELFEDGFVVPPSFRAGDIVNNKEEFFAAVVNSLEDPQKYSARRKEIAARLHIGLDGKSTERAAQVILENIERR